MSKTKLAKYDSGPQARHISGAAVMRANDNVAKREHCLSRGHRSYVQRAWKNARMYVGGGEQWSLEDRQAMEEDDRRCVEENRILPIINTAVGYQIANRMDITLSPRGRGADDETASTLQKVIKKVCDDNKLHWLETDVVRDGFIEQRGFFDVRMSFEENIYGTITITTLDPRCVMPCPDGSSYEPDKLPYWIIDDYMVLDEIEAHYGKSARRAVQLMATPSDTLGEEMDSWRERFGNSPSLISDDYRSAEDGTDRYLVITRQYRTFELTQCAVWPTGDIRPIPNATPEQIKAYEKQGAIITKRAQTRYKFLVTCGASVLFDDYSPYPWYTIVPYYPYFHRGITRGLVDNAISPQEGLNKARGQIENIVDHISQCGYFIEQNSIVGMSDEEARKALAQNGAVLVVKQGARFPVRIDPPQVPAGVVELIRQDRQVLADIIGETLEGGGPTNEMSGVAYQARQYAAQQKLSIPLDNLGRTRHGLATRIIDLVQMFMDVPQIIRITESNKFGEPETAELYINQNNGGDYVNDLTVGEYDIVISEQPMQVTFDNSQFEQVKSLKMDFEYPIPASYALRYSNLSDKAEIAKAVEEASQVQPDPLVESTMALNAAKQKQIEVDTMNKRIEAVYGSTQAATQIAVQPQVAGIADEILQSAGFDDQNPSPIIPQGMASMPAQAASTAGMPAVAPGAGLAQIAPPVPIAKPLGQGGDPSDPSTNPTTPENPGVGLNAGAEKPGFQGDA